jgi:hypothetical protein
VAAGGAPARVPRIVEDDRATEEEVPGGLRGWRGGREGAEGRNEGLRM